MLKKKECFKKQILLIYIVHLLDTYSKIQLCIFVQFFTTLYPLNSCWTDNYRRCFKYITTSEFESISIIRFLISDGGSYMQIYIITQTHTHTHTVESNKQVTPPCGSIGMTNCSESRIQNSGHTSVLHYMYISYLFYKLTSSVYINEQQIAPKMAYSQMFIVLVLWFKNIEVMDTSNRKLLIHYVLKSVLFWDFTQHRAPKDYRSHLHHSRSLKSHSVCYLCPF